MAQSIGRSSSFGPDMGRRIMNQVRQMRSMSFRRSGSESVSAPSSPVAMRDLEEFLCEAELGEYYPALLSRLKVSTVEHLKYVQEEDLEDIGMSRPEMRRLKKFYRKEYPQGTFNKLRKAILRSSEGSNRTLSPSPPQQRSPRPVSGAAPYIRPPARQLIPADALSLNKVLGEGDFGVVQQAVWTTDSGEKVQVAVKRVSRERVNTDSQSLLKEAAIMQELDHEHVVRMYGVVMDTEENIMMVTELAPMRSLLECLKDPSLRVDLPLPRLCDYAQQVCDGMAYLENRRLVHRDLAARNILVFSKNQVKISDLGLSRLLGAGQDYYQSKFSVSLKLPIAWCAPECINFLKFTSASDVWAFGVMLWEFFTYGFQPWAGLNGQQVLEAISPPSEQRLEQPDLCTQDYYSLMKECWTNQPQDRPTFASMMLRLPQLRPTQVKALKDYPSPTVEKGYIYYKTGDVIVVIDKTPSTSSPPGLVWRGVLSSGKSGLFDPTNVVPFVEPKFSPINAKTNSLARKESGRKSSRKIRADMISRPQNDLRHTGHIGYDGAVFGDVSFIGDNYDKLPVKVEGGGASRGSSMTSISRCHDNPDHNGHIMPSNSTDSLDKPTSNNGYGQSWISRESLNSQSTFHSELQGRQSPSYLDVEDDSLFADFKMPDLGSSFDFGPSFMDEVLKALDEKEKQVTSPEATPTGAPAYSFAEEELKGRGGTSFPPRPAPRGELKSTSSSSSSSAPPLPSQPPRVETHKEKKQAKVKPMSASDERMVDTALARAKELTSHMIGDARQSPPVSPSSHDRSGFFDEDSPGIISKLKNSIRRSTSPKSERKRTFSEELENKADLDADMTPEAQQAYNMLVVRGSVKEGPSSPTVSSTSSSSSHHHVSDFVSSLEADSSKQQDWRGYGSRTRNFPEPEATPSPEPDLIRDSKRGGSPPKISAPFNVSSSSAQAGAGSGCGPPPPIPSSRPLISAPQLQPKPVGVSQPKPASQPAPVPAPRPVKQPEPPGKKSEIPVPRPRPEIQRVEPTVRHQMPESPEIPAKSEKRIDTHIPVPASRKEDSKEREREELKRTIEIVRVEDSNSYLRGDDSLEKVSTSFDRTSARSSQRSSLDRSDNTSENAESERAEWEHSEYSSDSSKPGRDSDSRANTSLSSVERRDSFNKKQTSLFEEDFSEPSPQEIMSKLRERRLNRHLDHQRALSGDGEASSSASAAGSSASSRPRPTAREPQGIPGRTASVDQDDGRADQEEEEVDTNPLRMLRGGAIPIRTAGRGSAGTGNHRGNRGATAAALRVPRLYFSSSHLSRTKPEGGQEQLTVGPEASSTHVLTAQGSPPRGHSSTPGGQSSTCVSSSSGRGSMSERVKVKGEESTAEFTRELERLTHTLMEGDLGEVASLVLADTPLDRGQGAQGELRKFSASGCQMDLSQVLPPTHAHTHPHHLPTTYYHNEQNRPAPAVPRSYGRDGKVESVVSPPLTPSWSQSGGGEILESVFAPQAPTWSRSGGGDRIDSIIVEGQIAPSQQSPVGDNRDVPPRLPPRRSQSVSEDPEKEINSHVSRRMLRRSNSLEGSDSPPALPPRDPQPAACRTPLNARPRERKHPLPPTTPQSPQPHTLPSSPWAEKRSAKLTSHSMMTRSLDSQMHPATPAHPSSQLSPPVCESKWSSVDLPPTYDMSVSSESHVVGETVADTEPTHMLLDPHMSHLSHQPLAVSLPPATDFTLPGEEPTHVSLSSITHNKHSWSAAFTSPSPLSPPSFTSTQQPPPLSHSSRMSPGKSFHRSLSHTYGQGGTTSSSFGVSLAFPQCPSLAESQSPPADLPPAPPTPSYRDKLGLDPPRTKVVRSISYTAEGVQPPNRPEELSLSHTTSNMRKRQKNCEEVETLLKVFPNEVSVEECTVALESSQWDVSKATKYLQLKQLLSLELADVHRCKQALLASGWHVHRAADLLLQQNNTLASTTTTTTSYTPTALRTTTTSSSSSPSSSLLCSSSVVEPVAVSASSNVLSPVSASLSSSSSSSSSSSTALRPSAESAVPVSASVSSSATAVTSPRQVSPTAVTSHAGTFPTKQPSPCPDAGVLDPRRPASDSPLQADTSDDVFTSQSDQSFSSATEEAPPSVTSFSVSRDSGRSSSGGLLDDASAPSSSRGVSFKPDIEKLEFEDTTWTSMPPNTTRAGHVTDREGTRSAGPFRTEAPWSARDAKSTSSSPWQPYSSEAPEAVDDFRKVKLRPSPRPSPRPAPAPGDLRSSKFMSRSTESIFTDVKLKPVAQREGFKSSDISKNAASVKSKSRSSDLSQIMNKFSVHTPASSTSARSDH
ncbi:mucin-5AC, partial [Aplysia californica]|uniref:non-specific protein-tyrosine kinase n=1 Tax=Aplysia californica TaxID=6500 RepID=A0ABM1ADX7_APLCA